MNERKSRITAAGSSGWPPSSSSCSAATAQAGSIWRNVVETQTRLQSPASTATASTAECVNPVARGYPFRIGLFCDRVAFTDADQGIALSAGGFRSAGQIYDPKRLVAELDGPARIDLPGHGPLALDWDGLRASVRLAQPVPERISLEGTTLKASMASGEPLATVGAFEAHMRPNGDDLDLAGSFAGLAIEQSLLDGRKLPSLSQPIGPDAQGRRQAGRLGRAEPARPIGNDQDPDGFDRSRPDCWSAGRFRSPQDGLLDADLTVTVRDPKGLSRFWPRLSPNPAIRSSAAFPASPRLAARQPCR